MIGENQELPKEDKKAVKVMNKEDKKAVEYVTGKAHKFVSKILESKLSNKDITKGTKQATVIVNRNEPLLNKMNRDKSRYFKETWEEERRNLFFK